MAKNWNQEQLEAIKTRNTNILVSASAGSGKTGVLVQRLVELVTLDHIEIDQILAMTFSEDTAHALTLKWGVVPIVSEKPETTDDMFNLASTYVVEHGFASEGDLILITAGVPVGESGTTNLMKIQMIGSKLVQGQGIGSGTVVGRAVVADNATDAIQNMTDGAILVVKTTDKDYLPAIEKASAIVVEQGGLTSHAAVVGIAMGIPVVVAAESSTSLVNNGELITVDSRRGIVYRGETVAI